MTLGTLTAEALVVRAGKQQLIGPIDATIPTGSFTAVIGPNGAGKSTLLHALAGISRPHQGRILLGSTDMRSLPRRERAQHIAFVEQDTHAGDELSVGDIVLLGRLPMLGRFSAPSENDRRIATEALRATRTDDLWQRSFMSLSGGERQRVLLARALAQQTEVLILDEPTNHLDVRAQIEVLDVARRLAENGATVIAAIHDLTLTATYADRVIVLADGQLVAEGSMAGTLTAPLIEAIFRVRATFVDRPGNNTPLIALESMVASPTPASSGLHASTNQYSVPYPMRPTDPRPPTLDAPLRSPDDRLRPRQA